MNHADVRLERVRRGLQQQELASMIGISKDRLCRYEKWNLPIPPEAERKLEIILFPAERARSATGC